MEGESWSFVWGLRCSVVVASFCRGGEVRGPVIDSHYRADVVVCRGFLLFFFSCDWLISDVDLREGWNCYALKNHVFAKV